MCREYSITPVRYPSGRGFVSIEILDWELESDISYLIGEYQVLTIGL